MLHGLLFAKRNPVDCGAVCRTHVPFLKRLLIAPVGRGDAACRIDSSREKGVLERPAALPFTVLIPSRENATQPDPQVWLGCHIIIIFPLNMPKATRRAFKSYYEKGWNLCPN